MLKAVARRYGLPPKWDDLQGLFVGNRASSTLSGLVAHLVGLHTHSANACEIVWNRKVLQMSSLPVYP